jgi:hypothetical protein
MGSFWTFSLQQILMTVQAMPSTPDWNELYRLAITEIDFRQLPKRIASAQNAIVERIAATVTEPCSDEQQMMCDALNGLRVLQKAFENHLQQFGEPGRGAKERVG